MPTNVNPKKGSRKESKEKIPFSYINERGRTAIREHTFEGVVPNLQRRYRETDSMAVKEELAKYQNNRECPECHGSRLRKEALSVTVGKYNLATISMWQLKKCAEYFSNLQLEGNKQEIANKIVKEIITRVGFLIDVGLDYLTLNRSADTLSGGEAQRIRLASQIGSGLTGAQSVAMISCPLK